MGDADYEVDFEARNTFLHVTVRPTTAGQLMTRSRSWTPSTSSNHSSEQSIQSIPAGWLPATASPAVVEVVGAGHEPGPQPPLHQVFNLTSATSSSSKESSSQSFLSESKLREAVAAFREGGERQEEEELEYRYELPSRGSEGHFEGRCQPCRFIHLGDGCRNGFNCNFCHEEHETQGGKTHRPSKGVRSGYKRTVNQIVESDMPEEEKMEAYQRLAERSPYMRCLLKAVVPNIDELVKTRGETSSGPSSSGAGCQLPATEPRIPGLQPHQEDKSPTKISL